MLEFIIGHKVTKFIMVAAAADSHLNYFFDSSLNPQKEQLLYEYLYKHIYYNKYLHMTQFKCYVYRVTPSFAFVVAVMTTFGYRITDGPFWKRSARMTASLCNIKWWNTFLYIYNYTQPRTMVSKLHSIEKVQCTIFNFFSTF